MATSSTDLLIARYDTRDNRRQSGRYQFYTAPRDILRVSHRRLTRPTGRKIGPFDEVENAGVDTRTLQVTYSGDREQARQFKRANGRPGAQRLWWHIRTDRDAKESFRVMVEEDKTKLSSIDAEIDVALQKVETLRAKRQTHVRDAWKRGHYISKPALREMMA